MAAQQAGEHAGVVACTIVAANYVAQASVLCESFRRIHPEHAFVTLIVDGTEQDRTLTGLGTVLLGDDLIGAHSGLDRATLHSMMLIYDVMEFCTAVKPFLLRTLLHRGAEVAAYFDPDILVYDRLDPLFEAASRQGICLTPHTIHPFPDDDLLVSERMVMWAGIFNLGFIAVSPAADDMLAWWGRKLETDAISDPQNALFTDQRWIDWVPAIATPHVERDPGYNVAHWNLHERALERTADGWLAGGHPLRFVHFSGYDPATPWLLSKHSVDAPRVLLSERPELRELADVYGALLVASGHPELRLAPYRWGRLATGAALPEEVRKLCRRLVIGELVAATPAPDPFDEPAAFEQWLQQPQFGSAVRPLTPLQLAFWMSRPDVQAVFPDPLGAEAGPYLSWFTSDESIAAWLDSLDLPPLSALTTGGTLSPWVVVTADRPGSDDHLAAERLTAVLESLGRDVELVDAGQLAEGDVPAISATWAESTVVFCVTASQTTPLGTRFGMERLGEHRIALVLSDPEALPAPVEAFVLDADEVWASTAWIAQALERRGVESVARVRIPVPERNHDRTLRRASFGIPPIGYLFLCEPLGVPGSAGTADLVDTYLRTFTVDAGTVLAVLTDGLSAAELEWLRSERRERADLVLIDGERSARERAALRDLADCWTSFDAPGGYSATIADVVGAGTPIVAPAHPSTLEHVSLEHAALLPLRESDDGMLVDRGHAVRTLRSMVDYPTKGRRLAAGASAALRASHSMTTAGRTLAPIVARSGLEEH